MANIRKETFRHIWDRKYVFQPQEDDADDRGMVLRLHCRNCRKLAKDNGSAPVNGCAAGVDISKLGRESAKPYLEDEAKALAAQ